MKCDVTISKKMTFNTGNYSSVSPALTITIKDVNVKHLPDIHKRLDIITDGLYHKQIKSDLMTKADLKHKGIGGYFKHIDMEEIDIEIQSNIDAVLENGSF